ncbi:MAG: lasso peptide biosynthesis B2 protein [Aliidongia sp.]
MTSRYFLSNQVFLSRTSRHYVFLDLKSDRYWAVAQDQLEAIGQSLQGWSACDARPVPFRGMGAADAHRLVDVLVRRGLLTTDPASGSAVAPTCFPLPKRALLEGCQPVIHHPGFRHLRIFVIAGCSAGLKRRWQSIAKIVGSRARRHRSDLGHFDESRCRELVAVFGVMRPYFPGKPSCLLDSFMLVEFLARYGMHAHWVFGVRTEPFSAHCWVQRDDLVLNDTLDHVGTFVPIMAV